MFDDVLRMVGENREKWDAGETRHDYFSVKTTHKSDFLVTMTKSISWAVIGTNREFLPIYFASFSC